MNSLVNYRLAKLLKEKGFDEPCRYVYDTWNNIKDWLEDGEGEHRNSHKNRSVYYSAPTIAKVVMWLYERHKIWISVPPPYYEEGKYLFCWLVQVLNDPTVEQNCWVSFTETDNINGFETPEKAYESGVEYVLLNLFKTI